MLEDLFYEILPVTGFAVLASSVFVFLVMRGSKGAFRFVLFFATADTFLGLTLIIFGFHGVMTTIYGTSGEMVKPLDCVLTRIHLLMELLSDSCHSLLLLFFAIDRLFQTLVPVQYSKLADVYTNWTVFIVITALSGLAIIPSVQYPIQSRNNATVLISPMCRFEQVFGENYFADHMWAIQWVPLVGLSLLACSFVVFGIRSLKQRWSYNWSESGEDTMQLSTACVIRCLMAALAVHLPLLIASSYPADSELSLLVDVLIRVSFSLCLPILQPIYYLLTMPLFTVNVQKLFNKYGNTKRTWQSAADPPKPDEHVDPHGDRNPFGSWYSTTGNVVGEAGIPTEERAGIERSISFYYQEETPANGNKSPTGNIH